MRASSRHVQHVIKNTLLLRGRISQRKFFFGYVGDKVCLETQERYKCDNSKGLH